MNGAKHHFQHAGASGVQALSPRLSLPGATGSPLLVPGACNEAGLSPPPAQLLYACPLHRQAAMPLPGFCQLCRSPLEVLAPGGSPADAEPPGSARRFWSSLPLTALVVGVGMAGEYFPIMFPGGTAWLQLVLCLPLLLWAAGPVLVRGWRSIGRRHPDRWAWISLTLAVLGVAAAIAPANLAAPSRAGNLGAGYAEIFSIVVSLVLFCQMIEQWARRQAKEAVATLMAQAPVTARLLHRDGSDEQVPLGRIRTGDLLSVFSGDRIPADGRVVHGASMVDESMLSGEFVRIEKRPGAPLMAASVNGEGELIMRVEALGSQTVLSRIIAKVMAAQESRPALQRPVDVLAPWAVLAGLGMAVLGFFIWTRFGPEPHSHWMHATLSALAVLLVACPWALDLATPMVVAAAAGRGARLGILFRDGVAIEGLHAIDTLVVDKTGILTEGRPVFHRMVTAPGWDETRLLQVAASLEQAACHPLASTIVKEARRQGMTLIEPMAFEAVGGFGVRGLVQGRQVAIGSAALMEEGQVYWEVLGSDAEALRQEGASVVFVAVDNKPAGIIATVDRVKATSDLALRQLGRAGVRVVMVTGDSWTTAQSVAARLGVDLLLAEVRPVDKLALVRRLQVDGCRVAMAGHGVSDAAALAQADVSIAIGGSSADVPCDTDVALIRGDLRTISLAHALSIQAVHTMRGNLFFAGACHAVGVPLAVGLVYPLAGWLMSPAVAALTLGVGLIVVAVSSLRLLISRL